jgi:hypothetical protein
MLSLARASTFQVHAPVVPIMQVTAIATDILPSRMRIDAGPVGWQGAPRARLGSLPVDAVRVQGEAE